MGLPSKRSSRGLGAPRSEEAQLLDQLTTGAPGDVPSIADAAVQAAAAEGRMRIGIGRSATFLTGLGRSASDSSTDSGGAAAGSRSSASRDRVSGLDLRRLRVGTRSNPGGIFDGP